MNMRGGLLLMLLWGCQQRDPGVVFYLEGVVPVDAQQCQAVLPSGSNTLFQTFGRFDPRRGESYVLPLLVRNQMASRQTNPILLQSGENIAREANDINVTSIEVCWFEETAGKHTNEEGVYFDCDSLPASQHKKISIASSVAANGGRSVLPVRVLEQNDLKTLWGDSFAPEHLPVRGLENNVFYPGVLSASTDPRSVHWGNFPHLDKVQVIVQARVLGGTTGGESVSSNWVAFPVEICVGCSDERCGDRFDAVECAADTCEDATTGAKTSCGSGGGAATLPLCAPPLVQDSGCISACASLTACSPRRLGLRGSALSLNNVECLPAQFVQNPTCAALNPCESLLQ